MLSKTRLAKSIKGDGNWLKRMIEGYNKSMVEDEEEVRKAIKKSDKLEIKLNSEKIRAESLENEKAKLKDKLLKF